MPTQESLDAFKHVFNDRAKQNVETVLGSHPDILMNSLTAMEALREQYPTGTHPLLMGEEKVRPLHVHHARMRARTTRGAGVGRVLTVIGNARFSQCCGFRRSGETNQGLIPFFRLTPEAAGTR